MALWTPEYIKPMLWLDAADASTLTLVNGKVSQWRDKSGNGRYFSMETDSYRPVVGSIGGKPSVYFNINRLESYFRVVLNSATVFIVAAMNASSDKWGRFLTQTQGSTSDYLLNQKFIPILRNNGLNEVWSECYIGSGRHAITYDTLFHARSQHTGTDLLVEINFQNQSTNSSSTDFNQVFDKFVLGSGSDLISHDRLVGHICEIVYLDTSASDIVVEYTEGYLAHKWGLEAYLPSDHPYKSTAPIAPSLTGIIRDRLGNPCRRKVYAVSRPTNATAPQILAHGLSDAITGAYELTLPTAEEVTRVVVSEDDDPLLNDLVDRVIPA